MTEIRQQEPGSAPSPAAPGPGRQDAYLQDLLRLTAPFADGQVDGIVGLWTAGRTAGESLVGFLVRSGVLVRAAGPTLDTMIKGYVSYPDARHLFTKTGERLLAELLASRRPTAAAPAGSPRSESAPRPTASPPDVTVPIGGPAARATSPATSREPSQASPQTSAQRIPQPSSQSPSPASPAARAPVARSPDAPSAAVIPSSNGVAGPSSGVPAVPAPVRSVVVADGVGDAAATAGPVRPAASAEREPGIGDVVGPYRLRKRIAAGAKATVFEAEDIHVRRTVAVKVLSASTVRADGKAVQRFLREGRLAAKVDHAHWMGVLGVGTCGAGASATSTGSGTFDPVVADDDPDGEPLPPQDYAPTAYTAWPLARGGSVEGTLASAPLPADEATHLLRMAAEGMAAAHSAGVVHGNIRPSNLLLGERGELRVSEPAGTVAHPQAASLSAWFGRPEHLSPEQCDGRAPDPRSDVWGLGAVWFHLLTGRPPFEHGKPSDARAGARADAPSELRQLRPDLPDCVAAVMERMLALRPEDRYPDASAAAEALEQVAGEIEASAAGSALDVIPSDDPLLQSSIPATDSTCGTVTARGSGTMRGGTAQTGPETGSKGARSAGNGVGNSGGNSASGTPGGAGTGGSRSAITVVGSGARAKVGGAGRYPSAHGSSMHGHLGAGGAGDSDIRNLQPGAVLGRCLLTEKIGQGATGTVYRALHKSLNIPVAVKVLHSEELRSNDEARRQLAAEARLLAQLNHPNIVRVWDFDDGGELPFLVLEYINGLTLRELISQSGALRGSRACRIVGQLARALECAWESGIVHRDIKPANILLTKDGTAKLADLGLAMIVPSPGQGGKAGRDAESSIGGGSTHGGAGGSSAVGPIGDMMVGTAAYMAPEQALGATPADVRSDIYSLGATFYHAVTGSVPFKGRTMMDVMIKHAKEPPVPPVDLVQDLAPHVSDIILRMLAKRPEDRYGSYAELLVDLAGGTESSSASQSAIRSLTDLDAALSAREAALRAGNPGASKPALLPAPDPVSMVKPGTAKPAATDAGKPAEPKSSLWRSIFGRRQ